LLAKSSANNYIEFDTGGYLALIDFHTNSAYVRDWDARILIGSTTTDANSTASMSIDASFVQMTRVIASSLSNSGTLTNTGLITATGGLTIGGSNNITLGSGATNPTTGTQLGGSTKTGITSVILTTSLAQYATFTPPNAGTYLITTNFLLSYGGFSSTAGTVRYFWGTTNASAIGIIDGTNTYGYIPVNNSTSSLISLPSQSFIYQTPATPVALYFNVIVGPTTTVIPTISASNCYYQYTRIA
jgi:hypothetical protein